MVFSCDTDCPFSLQFHSNIEPFHNPEEKGSHLQHTHQEHKQKKNLQAQKPHRVMFYYNKEVHTIRAKENDGDIVIWLDDQLVGSVDDLLESTLIGKAPFMHYDVDITWFRLQDYWDFKIDTIQFDTPFGFIEVLKNGNRIPFHIEEGTYNTYFQDDLELHPLGCYEMAIDISDMAVGDIVVVRYSKGSIASDGGDEHTLNAVGEIDGYTIGLGVTDTDDLEELWQYDKEEYPDDPRFSRDRRYPYAHWGLTGSGVEFRIVDDPGKYPDDHYDTKNIIVSAVWESNDKEYAWDIVSFLTC